MSDDEQQTWWQTRQVLANFRAGIDQRLRRNPYGTVAAALGIGYLLGGGLFSRLTARILRVGLRIGYGVTTLPF
jgi:hypothetical protein